MPKSSFTAAILTLAAAGAVHAQALAITDVVVNNVKGRRCNPGQTVQLFGGPFLSTETAVWAKEISATIDGDAAQVTYASVGAISIPIPQEQRPGKITIRIVHAGTSATLEMTVVDPAKEKVAPGDEGGKTPGAPDAGDLVLRTFSVAKLTLVREPGRTHIDAEGTATRLDDGLFVTLVLERDGLDDAPQMRAEVRGGQWKARFGPWAKELPCGAWRVKLAFELTRQPRKLGDPFRQRLAAGERQAFDNILRQEVLEVGTPEDVAAQREQIKAHARQVAAAAKQMFEKIDAAYVSGSRCFFRVQGQFQAAKWEAWLQEQKLCETPAQLAAARTDVRFGNQTNGFFALKEWERFVREQLLGPIQAAKDQHAAYAEGWVLPLDPTVDRLERELLALVTERLRTTGQALCDQSKVALPDCVKELPAESVGQDQVSSGAFHAKWRLLLRTIGDQVPE